MAFGATFTHVDEKVSFEVLLASFGLETDPALARLAAIVHHLDVGGFPVPEAAAVDAALRGMRGAYERRRPPARARQPAF